MGLEEIVLPEIQIGTPGIGIIILQDLIRYVISISDEETRVRLDGLVNLKPLHNPELNPEVRKQIFENDSDKDYFEAFLKKIGKTNFKDLPDDEQNGIRTGSLLNQYGDSLTGIVKNLTDSDVDTTISYTPALDVYRKLFEDHTSAKFETKEGNSVAEQLAQIEAGERPNILYLKPESAEEAKEAKTALNQYKGDLCVIGETGQPGITSNKNDVGGRIAYFSSKSEPVDDESDEKREAPIYNFYKFKQNEEGKVTGFKTYEVSKKAA